MTLDVTLNMRRAVLQLADDPTTFVVCGTSDRSDAFSHDGDFRKYANGATRLILGSGTTRTLPMTLRALTPDQVVAVAAMVGKTCLFRDTYGRRLWGSFLDTGTVDIPLSGKANTTLLTDIAISFQTVAFTEGV